MLLQAPSDQSARYFADSKDVAGIIEKKNATLVDARELPQYHGLMKRDYVYSYGHLEGAKPLSPDTTVYCNSGAQSGLPWFILSELVGNPNVRQYEGSLHQWTLEKRPLVGAVPLK